MRMELKLPKRLEIVLERDVFGTEQLSQDDFTAILKLAGQSLSKQSADSDKVSQDKEMVSEPVWPELPKDDDAVEGHLLVDASHSNAAWKRGVMSAPPRRAGETVIHIHSLSNLPNMDSHHIKVDYVSDESDLTDCFVDMHLTDSVGQTVARARKTLAVRDSVNPVFGTCFRSMTVLALPDDVLHVKAYDEEPLSATQPIAHVAIPLTELPEIAHRASTDLLRSFEMKMDTPLCGEGRENVVASVALRRITVPATARRKTLYLIRHGSSMWNEAEANMRYDKMVGVDHPLNKDGVQQCTDLNDTWRSSGAWRHKVEKGDKGFEGASLILVSPLTRAVQTALVALHSHPTLRDRGLRLQRSMREVKNTLASLDTIGDKIGGDDIKAKACQCLADVGVTKTETSLAWARDVVFDENDVLSNWWTTKSGLDCDTDVEERLADFMSTVQFVPEASIICVGHSLFFRELMRHYIAKGSRLELSQPDLVEGLRTQKMANAACLRVDVFFPQPEVCGGPAPVPEIVAAEFMWGTGLAGKEIPPFQAPQRQRRFKESPAKKDGIAPKWRDCTIDCF